MVYDKGIQPPGYHTARFLTHGSNRTRKGVLLYGFFLHILNPITNTLQCGIEQIPGSVHHPFKFSLLYIG